MSKRTKHFSGFSVENGNISAKVSLDRFVKQFEEAQFYLDSQVMSDMTPYMPSQTGTFINVTKAQSASLAGTGKVVAGAAPQGRFLYYGKVMVDPVTESPWARPGAKKVVTDKDLTYGSPKATPKWFETAKKNHGKAWIDGVKKHAGG